MLLKLARKFIVVVSCFLFWKEPPWFSTDGMTASAFRLQFFIHGRDQQILLVHGLQRIHPVLWSHQGGGTTFSGMSRVAGRSGTGSAHSCRDWRERSAAFAFARPPQTHAIWDEVAPVPSRQSTVVGCD
jgi:hypothetical protein